jgi:hypothetical protein
MTESDGLLLTAAASAQPGWASAGLDRDGPGAVSDSDTVTWQPARRRARAPSNLNSELH